MRFLFNSIVKFLAFFFRTVRLPDSFRQLFESGERAVVVTQSRSVVMQGLLLSLAERGGMGGISELGSGGLVSVSQGGSDPLLWVCMHDSSAMAEELRTHSESRFCTFNVFQLRGPIKNIPNNKPGFWWLAGLMLTRRFLFIEIGTPFRSTSASVSRLARQIKLDFYRHLKLVRGIPFQSMAAQERAILSGHEFEREIKVLAERAGESTARMRRRARAAFYELAANPRRFMYGILAPTAHFVVHKLFSEVKTVGLERVVPAIKNSAVVLIPMHRSHLDYILVTYKMYSLNVNTPIVAAGINLSFWPAGFFFRSVGAYFVKRNARDRQHALVLKRYVTYLTKRGHLQEFFIEGGRSRSGKMLPPRTGLLGMYVDAFLRGLRKDILFVPVAVTYEHVVEVEDYAAENSGSSKSRESFLSLLRSLGVFKKKYGDVTVTFGEPLSLSAFCNARGIERSRKAERRGRLSERNLGNDLGYALVRSIREMINPTFSSLVCTALIMAPSYGLKRKELKLRIAALCEYLKLLREEGYRIGEFSPELERYLRGEEGPLDRLIGHGLIKARYCLDDQVFFIDSRKRFSADYYRNMSGYYFFHLVILSVLQAMGRNLSAAEAARFHAVFQYEHLLNDHDTFQQEIEKLITLLGARGVLSKGPEGISFSEAGLRFCIPTFVLSSLESMLWTHYSLKFNQSARISDSAGIEGALACFSYPDFVNALQDDFAAARSLSLFSRNEAESRSSLIAALDSLNERQVISYLERPGQVKRILLKVDNSEELKFLSDVCLAVNASEQRAALSVYKI